MFLICISYAKCIRIVTERTSPSPTIREIERSIMYIFQFMFLIWSRPLPIYTDARIEERGLFQLYGAGGTHIKIIREAPFS